MKCPHCDVSLSQHNNGQMVCHYCGHREPVPKVCPCCGSKYIAGFKAGTQRMEQLVQERFPKARILRMDFDTTRTKDSYEKILQSFANREADILIGTQMIVKGHDFAHVTLVGILAADLSLHVSDYHGAERTFQLLTQAAGRAGRGELPGEVVIQTYTPQHFAIETAKRQDYEAFYEQEIAYRKLLHYPPDHHMLVILVTSGRSQDLEEGCGEVAKHLRSICAEGAPVQIIGPADAGIAKINDVYRKVIYIKTKRYRTLVAIKDALERCLRRNPVTGSVNIQYDFDPMSGF